MRQFTKEQAIKIAESELWKDLSFDEIVKFQLYQELLCMPFDKFHQAIEKVLDRPIWTHEFAYLDAIKKEYEGKKEKPTMDEIIGLIPKDKLIIKI